MKKFISLIILLLVWLLPLAEAVGKSVSLECEFGEPKHLAENISKIDDEIVGAWEFLSDLPQTRVDFDNLTNLKDVIKNNKYQSQFESLDQFKTALNNSDNPGKLIGDLVTGVGEDLLALFNKQKQRLQNLKTQYVNLDFKDFSPIGGKTRNDITSNMYNEMFADLGSRNTWTTQDKVDKIVELLGSGKTIPQKVTYQQGTELFKVVKKGAKPSDFTEYWFTKVELDNLMSKGTNFESKAGLPLGSMADEYDIYKITASQSATTYRSTIAPTVQRGYTTTGGASQTLVLNRSVWSSPVKHNIESFIPDF